MMAVDPPADLEAARYAFRLGWAIAELRGRYRPDRHNWRPPGSGPAFKRGAFQLPMASERSPAEIRLELVDTLEDLSQALKLDHDPDVAQSWGALKAALEASEKRPTEQSLWEAALPAFYKWDAHVQDAQVLFATQAAAYQLGRGLAETYWGLEPHRSDSEMGSWAFVLGEHRRDTLQRLAARLSSYVGPLVLAAVEGPLASWNKLAAEPNRRAEPNVEFNLFRQGLLWRDLVRGERQPQDLPLSADLEAPGPADLWKDLKLYRETFDSLRQPLIGAILSIMVLAGGGAVLASRSGSNGGVWGTVIILLGAAGVTSAGLYARAKANVTSLLTTLKTRVELERVRRAADLCP